MDAEHRYEIIIRKSELLIELSSDDLYFISKQMDKWFRILLDDSYVPVSTPVKAPPAPRPEPEPVQQEVAPTPKPIPTQQQEQLPVEKPVETPVEEAPKPAPPPKPEPEPEPVQKSVQNIQQPQQVQEPAPKPKAKAPEPEPEEMATAPQPKAESAEQKDFPAQDDFEKVMDTLMEDLGQTEEGEESEEAAGGKSNGRPDMELINSLTDLVERCDAESPEDYLLMSAYYLTYFEAVDKFSLKRINSLMVQSGLAPVNHSVLEEAIERNLIAMVPDMTGTADVSEYSMTKAGQNKAETLL